MEIIDAVPARRGRGMEIIDAVPARRGRGMEIIDAVPAKRAIGGAKPKRPNPRAEIVRKVMKEKGLSLIEASKFVKANHLY